MEKFDVKVTKVEDAGMTYEVETYKTHNHPSNIQNGGIPVLSGTQVFRLKANGTRGLRLKNFNARLAELVRKVKAAA